VAPRAKPGGGFVRALRPLFAVFLLAPVAAQAAADAPSDRRSGYAWMSRETRAMQDDDASSPGMLWVLDGETLWSSKAGSASRSCYDCHGDARASMKGVAARYPAFDAARGRPVNIEQRINQCRADRQQAKPFSNESRELLSLAAYIGMQSRGLPISITIDARTKPFLEAGREAFNRRQGQINLSCALCHDDNWGRRLAGNVIPQGHPTGYPLYRLEWQGMGTLQRRLRNCLSGIRAQTPEFGADELVDLEFFLMWRARGMRVETPAVRP
jgi:L-cysteine S-thiosulfotransferase